MYTSRQILDKIIFNQFFQSFPVRHQKNIRKIPIFDQDVQGFVIPLLTLHKNILILNIQCFFQIPGICIVLIILPVRKIRIISPLSSVPEYKLQAPDISPEAWFLPVPSSYCSFRTEHLYLFFSISAVPKEHPVKSARLSIVLRNTTVFPRLSLIFFYLFRDPHINACPLTYLAQDPDGIFFSI